MADQTPSQDELMDKFVGKLLAEDGKLIPSILDHVHEQVEKSISGLKDKNAELLDELKKSKSERDELRTILASGGVSKPTTGDIWLSKDDARDPLKYRAARKKADEAGVQVLIEGRHAKPE